MRTLGEIIEAAKNAEELQEGELLYGLLALASLYSSAAQDLLTIWSKSQDDSPFGIKWRADEAFKRSFRVMNTDPEVYLGATFRPDNPEYQAQRKMFAKLLEKITEEKEDVKPD